MINIAFTTDNLERAQSVTCVLYVETNSPWGNVQVRAIGYGANQYSALHQAKEQIINLTGSNSELSQYEYTDDIPFLTQEEFERGLREASLQ